MTSVPEDLKALVRTIADFPKPGIQFRDITTLLLDRVGLARAVDALASTVEGPVDLVAAIEARGFAIGGALAVSLGFKQSAWELWHSSYYFLLHRPASRTRIFGTKLAVGIGAGWVLTAAIVLLFGAWAATPGNSAAPFFWSMTGTAWRIWFALPVLYLGAFLSGIRPGRWFGSRLIPLVTAGAVVAVSVMVPCAGKGSV